jgi:hypothetical protein
MKPFKIIISVNEDTTSLITIEPKELPIQLELVQTLLLQHTRMIERELTAQLIAQRAQQQKVKLVHNLPSLEDIRKQ